jgi:hypothetical protein
MRMRAMSTAVFERKFQPITDETGNQLRENSYTLDFDLHYVWSVIDADCSGRMYLIPGYHVVNLMDYVVTKEPWTDADERDGLTVKW